MLRSNKIELISLFYTYFFFAISFQHATKTKNTRRRIREEEKKFTKSCQCRTRKTKTIALLHVLAFKDWKDDSGKTIRTICGLGYAPLAFMKRLYLSAVSHHIKASCNTFKVYNTENNPESTWIVTKKKNHGKLIQMSDHIEYVWICFFILSLAVAFISVNFKMSVLLLLFSDIHAAGC